MTLRFDGRVAIVTGAGGGLGRAYALMLAMRGAKVVVNDLGAARDGVGANTSAAEAVVQDIVRNGGEAFASAASVTDPDAVEAMVSRTRERWGRVDILINNAGILRDRTFAKATIEDFRAVFDVHVMGAVHCTKAVWETMRAQNYGRIVMTTSSSGLYGNFGQSNYAAAKMALIGLMNALHLEGAKNNVRVNAVAPAAATRMTEELLPDVVKPVLAPENVAPGVLTLVHEDAPSRCILCAGAGSFAVASVVETQGAWFNPAQLTPEQIVTNWMEISKTADQTALSQAGDQTNKFIQQAIAGLQTAE